MKKIIVILSGLFMLAACGDNRDTEAVMDTKIETVYMRSKISNQEVAVSLPKCVIDYVPDYQQDENGKIIGTGIGLRVERLAFSYPEFPHTLHCVDKQNSSLAKISTIFPPIDEEGALLLKSDLFKYLLYERVRLPELYLGSKNNMGLYKVSPSSDAVFVGRNFPKNNRPISISFIRYRENDKNNSFRYYFEIETFLKEKYRLKYTVVAMAKDPSQFAEKLRNLIEENKNVLDYPEVVAGFVENNERIAAYFEGKPTAR